MSATNPPNPTTKPSSASTAGASTSTGTGGEEEAVKPRWMVYREARLARIAAAKADARNRERVAKHDDVCFPPLFAHMDEYVWDASLSVDPHGASYGRGQVSAFSIPGASASPFTVGEYVGSVSAGGSCNCDVVSVCFHGAGTHTECLGHITPCGLTVDAIARHPGSALTSPFLVLLLTTPPEIIDHQRARLLAEDYPNAAEADRVITAAALDAGLETHAADIALWEEAGYALTGLALRTKEPGTPREEAAAAVYSRKNPPYVLPEAAQAVADAGFTHLLIDLPSMDREEDGGGLLAHRAFWNVDRAFEGPAGKVERAHCTITELAFFGPIPDGLYALSLNVAPVELDAAPSRPVFYSLKPLISE